MPEARQNTILITRPEPGARETAARISAMGFAPLISPALDIKPIMTRLPPPDAVAAVLITSGNALAACFPAFRGRKLLTVGDRTADRARELGFRDVISANGDAKALAALVGQICHPEAGPVLLPTARGQGGAIACSLRQAGFRVIRRVVYQTVAARKLSPGIVDALRSGQVRAALFFSAETARCFVRLIERHGLTETLRVSDAVAIGKETTVALQSLPWRRITDAAKPTQDAMLAELQ